MVGKHFAGGNKECNKVSLSREGHESLDIGCYCKDRTVEAWLWIIFQEKYVHLLCCKIKFC
jgi:hypothetical protein